MLKAQVEKFSRGKQFKLAQMLASIWDNVDFRNTEKMRHGWGEVNFFSSSNSTINRNALFHNHTPQSKTKDTWKGVKKRK